MENGKLIGIVEKTVNNTTKSPKNVKNEILGLKEGIDTRLKPNMIV